MKRIFVVLLVGALTSCATILTETKNTTLPPRTVLFSFDDGPNGRQNTTARILDVLAKHKVRAFFCTIGPAMERWPELVRRIDADGHVLVNHTWEHTMSMLAGERAVEYDVAHWETTVQRILDRPAYRSVYFRPAAGLITGGVFDTAHRRGLRILPATAHTGDSEFTALDRRLVAQLIKDKIRQGNGGIVVMHDGWGRLVPPAEEDWFNPERPTYRGWVPELLEEIILWSREQGYRLELPADLERYGYDIHAF